MKEIQGKSTLVRVSEGRVIESHGAPQVTFIQPLFKNLYSCKGVTITQDAIFSVQLRNSIFVNVKETTFKSQKKEILRFVHHVIY